MHAGMRPELLNERLLSLSNDTLAVVDLAAKGQGVSPPHHHSLLPAFTVSCLSLFNEVMASISLPCFIVKAGPTLKIHANLLFVLRISYHE